MNQTSDTPVEEIEAIPGKYIKWKDMISWISLAIRIQVLLGVVIFLIAKEAAGQRIYDHGAITRGDTTKKTLSLVFTGHEFAEGGDFIRETLKQHEVKASFFFTGDFYRNPDFQALIHGLKSDGHYLGAHSDGHLLYASWENRDSLLVSRTQFIVDLKANYDEMERFGLRSEDAFFYLPPYEWYNDSIAQWTKELGYQLINYSKGTLSHADYTTEEMPAFRSSEDILSSILAQEHSGEAGLKGFMLLIHIGAGPGRMDKFYFQIPVILTIIRERGYDWVSLEELLEPIP